MGVKRGSRNGCRDGGRARGDQTASAAEQADAQEIRVAGVESRDHESPCEDHAQTEFSTSGPLFRLAEQDKGARKYTETEEYRCPDGALDRQDG